MKKLFFLLSCCLMAGTIHALELQSPNGNLRMQFQILKNGIPVYSLSYKGKEVINPSKLGLVLQGGDDVGFGTEIIKSSNPKTSLYDGFSLLETKEDSFDETWQPVWGRNQIHP